MKIALAQLNPTIGNFAGNLAKIEQTMESVSNNADLVVFPELFLKGYPPRDLLENADFLTAASRAFQDLINLSSRFTPGILCGTIIPTGKRNGLGLYNAAVLVRSGQCLFQQNKTLLPVYDVFDEERYFDPAESVDIFPYEGENLGIMICEDAWNDPEIKTHKVYSIDPVAALTEKGATVFINLSASPFEAGKESIRHGIVTRHAKKTKKPFLLVNQIGGNDELVFDGRSMVALPGGIIHVSPAFEESVSIIDLDHPPKTSVFIPPDPVESVYGALVLGLRDYINKTGFKDIIIGLSGGVDSALVACLAVQALGPEHVLGVSMPSPYSSKASVEDARALANNLGIRFKIIPITPMFNQYLENLKEHFEGRPADTTEENIQARIRGVILMALSNKLGSLVLTTGNKSEMSVGYCTLYGDMCGGLAVIADVPKMMVYAIARFINRNSEIIPESILIKPPSAELKPNQTDQDTLPPYKTLDKILELYLDHGFSRNAIVENGFDPAVVDWIIRSIKNSEYKRRQAAPGLKVTSKAFGMGRRMPIAVK
jgi:NAD+ synthase (glutamine-hydrolysing)